MWRTGHSELLTFEPWYDAPGGHLTSCSTTTSYPRTCGGAGVSGSGTGRCDRSDLQMQNHCTTLGIGHYFGGHFPDK